MIPTQLASVSDDALQDGLDALQTRQKPKMTVSGKIEECGGGTI